MPYLDGAEEIFIQSHGFLVARLARVKLFFKAFALVDGVVSSV
jgi:hypothetical protein